MTTILLIRHGENDYIRKGLLAGRQPGVHLNAKGWEQARNLAERLAALPIKAVYSSPLERTMETARPLAEALGLPVLPREGLIEVDVGEWQNEKVKRLARSKLWKKVQHLPSRMRFPAGETFRHAQYRICNEIEALVAEHEPDDLLVCVTHADPIRLAVAYYLGMPIDMFQRIRVAPASVTALWFGEGEHHLLTLNYEFSFRLPKG